MNECINKWTTNLSSLNDQEFEQLLEHAEICRFHADILDEFEAETLPFIEMAFPDLPKNRGDLPYDGNDSPDLPVTPFHEYKGTAFTSMPIRHKPKGRSVEEEMISEKYRQILKTGITPENCRNCLEMLEKNNSIVQNSWSNTLNKARVLISLEEKKEAEKILHYVMKRFSDSRQAIGSAFEIFSWLEEVRYNEGYKADRKTLERRTDYINKGLKLYPENYMLWINAFEAACLKNYTDEAISYLKRLERIDGKIAHQYFFDSPIKKEISRADYRLKKEIIRLNPEIEMEIG